MDRKGENPFSAFQVHNMRPNVKNPAYLLMVHAEIS